MRGLVFWFLAFSSLLVLCFGAKRHLETDGDFPVASQPTCLHTKKTCRSTSSSDSTHTYQVPQFLTWARQEYPPIVREIVAQGWITKGPVELLDGDELTISIGKVFFMYFPWELSLANQLYTYKAYRTSLAARSKVVLPQVLKSLPPTATVADLPQIAIHILDHLFREELRIGHLFHVIRRIYTVVPENVVSTFRGSTLAQLDAHYNFFAQDLYD